MSATPQENSARDATERAEDMVDRAGERVGELAATLGRRLQVFVARAREEAEDIWAEAQSMRHGDQP
jgi:hypothetical protein